MCKTKLCMLCQISHIEGKSPATDSQRHCQGEMPSCECECRNKGDKLRLYADLEQSYKAVDRFNEARDRGLVR